MKKAEIKPDARFFREVANLYRDMVAAYDEAARILDFSCAGCPDNCCDSYFQHHTYTEWAYLWHGLKSLADEQLRAVTDRAQRYLKESEAALARSERPILMCPLNTDGLCTLYPYRLMICRLHGIPSTFTRPDGQKPNFPGCFRCQEQVAQGTAALLDRTPFFRRLVELELGLLGHRMTTAPRVKLTIAQMIVNGPPAI